MVKSQNRSFPVFQKTVLSTAVSMALLPVAMSTQAQVVVDPLTQGYAVEEVLQATDSATIGQSTAIEDLHIGQMSDFTNLGTITSDTNNHAPLTYNLDPLAVKIEGELGTFTNRGTIEAYEGSAIYLYGSSQVDTFINAGVIRAPEYAFQAYESNLINNFVNEEDGEIYGSVQLASGWRQFSGTAINRGLIEGSFATAFSVSGTLLGTLEHTGTINNVSYQQGSSAFANGLSVDDAVAGSGSVIIGDGAVINVYAESDQNSASARGVILNNVDGALTFHSGSTINASATLDSLSGEALARGVTLSSLNTEVETSGVINVSSGGSGYSIVAEGIYIDGTSATSSLRNTGEININLSGSQGLYGKGIYQAGFSGSALDNAGLIRLQSELTTVSRRTELVGMQVGFMLGSMTNSADGVIDVSLQADRVEDSIVVAGLAADANLGGVSNHGVIRVDVDVTEGSATSYGIVVNSVGSDITNSGLLAVSAGGSAEAFAVDFGDLYERFDNSGQVIATHRNADVDSVAIRILRGDGVINNLEGGLLYGSLDIGGQVTVNNHGVIALPEVGYGLINHNYNQSATGVLRIGASSTARYSQLSVGGVATFDEGAGIDVDVAAINTLSVDDQLLDVITAGTLNASSFQVTDNSALLDFTATIDGNTVDLIATKDLFIAEAVASSGNVALGGVASRLDRIDGGNMVGTISELNKLGTAQQVADAVESLLPSISGAVPLLTNHGLNAIRNVIGARQGGRGLASGDQFLTDGHFWVKPFGSWADQDDRQGVTGYEIDQQGLVLGVDGYINSDWELGAAFGYSMSDVDSSLAMGNHSVEIDSYQAKLYATYHLDSSTAINLQLGSGVSHYDSKRRIFTGDVASADYDGWTLQASAEFERSYALSEATTLTPYLFLDYSYVDVESYTEKGAGAANLYVSSDHDDALIVGLGAKLEHAFTDQLLLQLDMDAGYDLEADQTRLTAGFAGDAGATFTTMGMEPDVLVYNVGTGVQYRTESGVEMTLRYNLHGREDYRDQSVSANFRWAF